MKTYTFNNASPVEAARVSATAEGMLRILGDMTTRPEFAGSWSEVMSAVALVYAKFASQLVPLDVAQALIKASWESLSPPAPANPDAS